MMEDEEYYRRYLAGDEAAAEALVEAHADALVLYLNGYLRALNDAEDLMIEAFARVFARERPIRSRGSFRAHLYRTARNLALRQLRRKRLLDGWFVVCVLLQMVLYLISPFMADFTHMNLYIVVDFVLTGFYALLLPLTLREVKRLCSFFCFSYSSRKRSSCCKSSRKRCSRGSTGRFLLRIQPMDQAESGKST